MGNKCSARLWPNVDNSIPAGGTESPEELELEVKPPRLSKTLKFTKATEEAIIDRNTVSCECLKSDPVNDNITAGSMKSPEELEVIPPCLSKTLKFTMATKGTIIDEYTMSCECPKTSYGWGLCGEPLMNRGSFYAEIEIRDRLGGISFGVARPNANMDTEKLSDFWSIFCGGEMLFCHGDNSSRWTGIQSNNNSKIGLLLDSDNGTLSVFKEDCMIGEASNLIPIHEDLCWAVSMSTWGERGDTVSARIHSMPTPVIVDDNEYFSQEIFNKTIKTSSSFLLVGNELIEFIAADFGPLDATLLPTKTVLFPHDYIIKKSDKTSIQGNIVLIRDLKINHIKWARNAQKAGAVAIIFVSTDSSEKPQIIKDPNKNGDDIIIPVLSIGQSFGERLLVNQHAQQVKLLVGFSYKQSHHIENRAVTFAWLKSQYEKVVTDELRQKATTEAIQYLSTISSDVWTEKDLMQRKSGETYLSGRDFHRLVIKQKTHSLGCRFVELDDVANSLDSDGRPTVGRTDVFVSWTWDTPWKLLLDTLEIHTNKMLQKWKPAPRYWIDIFAVNQHKALPPWTCDFQTIPCLACAAMTMDMPAVLKSESYITPKGFERVINSRPCVEMLVVFESWSLPRPLSRVWCNYEMLLALQAEVKITIGLTSDQNLSLLKAMGDDVESVLKTVGNLDIENASATMGSDRITIFNLIRSQIGFQKMNSSIQEYIHNWCLEAGNAELQSMTSEEKVLSPLIEGLARYYQGRGKHRIALPLLQNALNGKTKFLGVDDPKTCTTKRSLIVLYNILERYEDAKILQQELLKTKQRNQTLEDSQLLAEHVGVDLFDDEDDENGLVYHHLHGSCLRISPYKEDVRYDTIEHSFGNGTVKVINEEVVACYEHRTNEIDHLSEEGSYHSWFEQRVIKYVDDAMIWGGEAVKI